MTNAARRACPAQVQDTLGSARRSCWGCASLALHFSRNGRWRMFADLLRGLLAAVAAGVLPGYFWAVVLSPRADLAERLTWSSVLSVASVPVIAVVAGQAGRHGRHAVGGAGVGGPGGRVGCAGCRGSRAGACSVGPGAAAAAGHPLIRGCLRWPGSRGTGRGADRAAAQAGARVAADHGCGPAARRGRGGVWTARPAQEDSPGPAEWPKGGLTCAGRVHPAWIFPALAVTLGLIAVRSLRERHPAGLALSSRR